MDKRVSLDSALDKLHARWPRSKAHSDKLHSFIGTTINENKKIKEDQREYLTFCFLFLSLHHTRTFQNLELQKLFMLFVYNQFGSPYT